MKDIDVLILCGGQGSRLKEVVSDRPKPMAEIKGRPFLDLLIEYLTGFGMNRIILSLGHMAEYIKDYYGTTLKPSLDIRFICETKPLGTGGAIKNAQTLISGSPFLVMNGDSFCPADLKKFYEFHRREKALLSMVLTELDGPEDFGSVSIDSSNRIIEFMGKKRKEKTWVNAGIYLFEKKLLSGIPADTFYSLEHDLFPLLAGKEFFGYVTDGKLIDIGTPERYEQAKRLL